ncbi:MAG: hypothetical protein BMS9Abin30_1049 [Gammaproteobacteria bacterium]|nr:MAG: hypothetical protein BMS9Abin30_1049 [Gammaproteobacteria bacterium]
MKSKLLFVTLALAIMFTGTASAEELNDNAPPVRVLKAALDLTDEQVVALHDLLEARGMENKAIADQIREIQAQLEDLLKSDAPAPAEVGGMVLDIQGLKQEVWQNHESYQQSFRELLTPEQLDRLVRINKLALANRASKVLRELKLH